MKTIRKKFLVVLGGGGHTAQLIKLIKLLGSRFDYEYVIKYEDPLSEKKLKKNSKVYYVHETRAFGDNLLVSVIKILRNLIESLLILIKSKTDLILSAGAGPSVTISILGKFLGKKVIFIESWSRIYNPSNSGKLVYPFSDLFFVQWAELKRKYPKAIYAGRLM